MPAPPSPPGGWQDLESQWSSVPKSEHFHHKTSQVLKAVKKESQSKSSLFLGFPFSLPVVHLPATSLFLSVPPHLLCPHTPPHTSSFSCPGRNVWGSMFSLWSGRAELGSARLETALSRPPALSGYPGRRQLSEAIWHILTHSPTGCSSSLNSAARRPQFDFNSPTSFSLAVTLISPVSDLLTDNLLAAGIFWQKAENLLSQSCLLSIITIRMLS